MRTCCSVVVITVLEGFITDAGEAAGVYEKRFQTYLNLYPGVKELYRINADG